jgi:uncharacterized protein YhfF
VTFPVVDGLRALELGVPGEMRRRLVDLVVSGRKRATAGLVIEYEAEAELAEAEGDLDADDFRASHRAYWAAVGTPVTDDAVVVQIYFELDEVHRG